MTFLLRVPFVITLVEASGMLVLPDLLFEVLKCLGKVMLAYWFSSVRADDRWLLIEVE